MLPDVNYDTTTGTELLEIKLNGHYKRLDLLSKPKLKTKTDKTINI